MITIIAPNTGIYFLTSPPPDAIGATFTVGESVEIVPSLAKTSGISKLNVFLSDRKDFEIQYTGSTGNYYDFAQFFDIEEGTPSFDVEINPPSTSGYFYALNAEDNYGSGATYYAPSSIKTFTINPLEYNVKPSGLEGIVVAQRNTVDKITETTFVAKWMKEVGAATYKVNLQETGNIRSLADSFAVDTPTIGGASAIVHGTGTTRIDKRFYSVNTTMQDYAYSGAAATPIFSAYDTTGLQWLDHTLIVAQDKALAPGFRTGESIPFEVAMGAGNTLSNKVYFGGAYNTGSNLFEIYPSGTLVSGSLYTGTYLNAPTGGFTETNPSGPEYGAAVLVTQLTGSLVATNLSGLILTEYEPRFEYSVSPFADYEFKVQTFGVNGRILFSF